MIPVLGSTPPSLDAGHELAELLQLRSNDALLRRRSYSYHLALRAALDELDAWLNDSRPYAGRHKKPWMTMAADVQEALADRGHLTQQQTPAIDALILKLQPPAIGNDPARRTDCQQQLGLARAELAQPATAVAAFDDLLAATQDLATPPTRLDDLADTFEDCLRAAGRTVRNVLEGVAGVLRNNLLQVKFVRDELGEDTDINVREDVQVDAKLSLDARADLCRRLLAAQDPPYYNIVWLCYQDAQIRLTSHRLRPGDLLRRPGTCRGHQEPQRALPTRRIRERPARLQAHRDPSGDTEAPKISPSVGRSTGPTLNTGWPPALTSGGHI